MPSDVAGGRTTKGRLRQDETGIRKQAMFQTPRNEGFDAGGHCGKADSLHSQIKNLPTPSSNDWKGSSRVGPVAGQLSEVVAGSKLNPDWVVRLMGFPDGWMDDLPPDPLAPLAPAGKRAARASADRSRIA